MKRHSVQDALKDYTDREHSQVKHTILESYLERCLMIIGQHFPKIAYIDGFAGPWESTTTDLADTSPGIAIKTMATCDLALKKKHKQARLRSIFVETEAAPAAQLSAYVQNAPSNIVRPEVWCTSFESAIPNILKWLEPGEFAFVFVDPCGWKGLVNPEVLAPLLQRKNTELLINFMWNFMNLATGHDDQHDNLASIFGNKWKTAAAGSSEAKRVKMMNLYRQQLTQVCAKPHLPRLRTAMLPIEYIDQQKIIFYMVYATHNATGLVVFREQAEEAATHQARLKLQHKLNKVAQNQGQRDMFGADAHTPEQRSLPADLTQLWMRHFPKVGDEIIVNYEVIADMIEDTDYLLTELQTALANLIKDGYLVNLDAKAARPKKAVNYRNKERLKRLR